MKPNLHPCIAEIGKPGSYHGCNKPARFRVSFNPLHGVRRADLEFCAAHLFHAFDKRHCTATVQAVTEIKNGVPFYG